MVPGTSSLDRRALLGAGVGLPLLSRLNPRGSRYVDLESLAERIAAAPRSTVFEVVRPLLADGLAWDELLFAVYLAGVRHVRPRPVGFKLHCVFVVESVFQLVERLPDGERLAAVLWNLDDFKNSQQRDVDEGDWTLAAPPRAAFDSKEEVVRALARGFAERDEELVDRAVTGAWRLLSLQETFELFWPIALRDFHNLGHKPIFVAHAQRTLARFGHEHALPVLRHLAYGLLDSEEEELGVHAESLRLAPELRADWRAGRRVPEASLELALAIRSATPARARAAILGGSSEGLAAKALWDGVRLAAADLFARGPGLLPVHPTTVTSALCHIAERASDETTSRCALLQAAAWIPLFREALLPRTGIDMQRAGIDELLDAKDDLVTVDELFAEPTREGALACLSCDGALEAYDAALRRHVFCGVTEHHQPKYAAVLLEDVTRADPRWRPTLLASALEYLPSARTAETETHAHAARLVAGLR